MRVETPQETYARWGGLIDLIAQGIDEVGTHRHAAPGASHRRRRHGAVFSGEIRADLLDWLEPRLPEDLEIRLIPNSGIEISGPGVVFSVRRPDSDGHAPGPTSERRRRLYSQLTLFDVIAIPAMEPSKVDAVSAVPTIIITWGYDPALAEPWLKLSAPAGPDDWHWRDEPIEAMHGVGLETPAEADEDPLAAFNDDIDGAARDGDL